MNTNITSFQYVLEYLTDVELYTFAQAYKIRGIQHIARIIDYCSTTGINSLLDDYSTDLKSMCDITLPENIPLLAKHFRLKHFPSEIRSYIQIADILTLENRYSEAEQVLLLAKKIAPNNSDVLYKIGRAHV